MFATAVVLWIAFLATFWRLQSGERGIDQIVGILAIPLLIAAIVVSVIAWQS